MAEGEVNGRVTMRELYALLEKRDDKITARLDEIMKVLEPLPALCHRIGRNEADIKECKDDHKDINAKIDSIDRKTNWFGGINATLAAIGSFLAAMLGKAP
jgi:SMC interacting uncharacterized protein involved in chromosome segregation